MDGFLTNLKNLKKLITRSENDESVPVDRNRIEDVRRIMAKTDTDHLIDADEMTQLVGASASVPKLDNIRRVEYIIDAVPVDRHRIEDVRQAMTKTDPDTLVDADEMTQLAGAVAPAPKLDDIKPRPSKNEISTGGPGTTHVSPIAPSEAVLTGLNVLQKPAQADEMWEEQKKEDNRDDGMPNPIEDDIFIYYD